MYKPLLLTAIIAAVCLLCAPAVGTCLADAASPPRPNILLILSDDHSVPHVGCYGDANCKRLDLTPNLDRFAAEGMRLGRAYTAAPQCAQSRRRLPSPAEA